MVDITQEEKDLTLKIKSAIQKSLDKDGNAPIGKEAHAYLGKVRLAVDSSPHNNLLDDKELKALGRAIGSIGKTYPASAEIFSSLLTAPSGNNTTENLLGLEFTPKNRHVVLNALVEEIDSQSLPAIKPNRNMR